MAIFLRIPTIEGDSLDANHKDWIDVDTVNHAITAQTASAGPRGAARRTAGSAVAEAFDINKAVDLSSVKLQQAVVTGQVFKEATIEITRRTANNDVVFLRYTLGNCVIKQWNLHASENGVAAEHVQLSFTELTTSFTPTSALGKEGPEVDFGWDFAGNEPL